MNYDAILIFPKIDFSDVIQYPTGLYKIASYCKDKYNILVLDERIVDDIELEIRNIIKESKKLLCIGLSVMTGSQIKYALTISKVFKNEIPIVWGGMHPTISVETIENNYIDYTIQGDGEEAFLNLLDFLNKKNIHNKLFTTKSNISKKYNIFSNFSESSEYIDFKTYPIDEKYFSKRDGMKKAFNLETSRGCPYNCKFCHNSTTKYYKNIDTELIIKTIEKLLIEYNIDGIIFQEDDFFANSKRLNRILTHLTSLKLSWKANCRINYIKKLVDKGFMEIIEKANCKVLQFGIESGSDRILKLLNKKITVSEIIRTNKILSEYSIKVRYNFIVGFPLETSNDIELTLRLIDRLKKDNPNVEEPFVNIYTPYPGTDMYELAIKEGFIPPKNLEGWINFSWNKSNLEWLKPEEREYIENISNEYKNKSSYLKDKNEKVS